MRGTVGRLCHGGERKPLEPYGVLAPFLRMAACAALAVGGVCGIVAVLAVHFAWLRLIPVAIVVGGLTPLLALMLRFLAQLVRPVPITLTAFDVEAAE